VLKLKRIKAKLCYGWIVVASIFLVGTVIWGLRFSFSVFFKSIEAEFSLSRGATSGVFSVYIALASIFAIVGGWAVDRYGPRSIVLLMGIATGSGLLLTSQASAAWQLYLSYSLLLAVGMSPMYVVAISTVSKWFDRNRGVALGIASSGAGLGAAVVAPLSAYLISRFGWQPAYAVIGIIVLLVLTPLSRLLKKAPYEAGALPDGTKPDSIAEHPPKAGSKDGIAGLGGLSVPQAFKTKSFWLITSTQFLYASGFFLVSTHIVPHATDKGIAVIEASAIFTIIGLTGILGRITMGMVADRIGSRAAVIICAALHTASLLWLIWVQDLRMLYMFAVLFGLAWGGIVPTMGALIGDTFGLGRLGSILGVTDVGFGMGAAIGPLAGGLIFDTTQSYLLAFLLGAAAMLIGILLIALVRRESGEPPPAPINESK
jgi:MFS family permease